MGDREKARVEGHSEGGESPCMGREDSPGVEESVEARVGESLGADRKPWMALSEQPKESFRIDANDSQMNLRRCD